MRALILLLLLPTLALADVCSEHRSITAKRHFVKTTPCPANGKHTTSCPGYVIDHVVPLCACGKDDPSNMQWQTLADAQRKDVLEKQQCRKGK